MGVRLTWKQLFEPYEQNIVFAHIQTCSLFELLLKLLSNNLFYIFLFFISQLVNIYNLNLNILK